MGQHHQADQAQYQRLVEDLGTHEGWRQGAATSGKQGSIKKTG
jgi:hypothetical protein